MITERLDLTTGGRAEKIARAAAILKNGGIVAIPTETVYGLAASAYSDEAIGKVFAAKGRPQDNPLIVHICDSAMLSEVAAEVPPAAHACAERFWPGPFTMVLKRVPAIADSVCAGLDTVGVRMPSDETARDIIRAAGPLAAPSANTSGAPSPTSAEHVLHDLDGKIDAVVIGERCAVGVESTVISLAGGTPRLLRPGGITVEQLREVLPGLIVDPAVLSEPEKGVRVASPGMKYKHYAPATETYLVEGDSAAYAAFVNEKSDRVAVCFEEDTGVTGRKLCYGSGKTESTLARNVFNVLRTIDTLGVSAAYVHAPSKTGVGLAVYNRLLRAAAFRVIRL